MQPTQNATKGAANAALNNAPKDQPTIALAKAFHAIITRVLDAARENANNN